MSWMMNDAPGLKPHWFGTLSGLANHADETGRGARPSQATLSWYARKDERNVREDLRALEAAGLIRKGDQRMVAHLPPDKRPIVWDLALELTRGPRPEPKRPGRPPRKRADADVPPIPPETGGRTDPPGCEHPPVSDLGFSENGGMQGVKRGDASVRQTSQEPKTLLLKEEGGGQPAPCGAQEDLTADEEALLAEVTAAAPRWSPASVRAVLGAVPVRDRPDRTLVRLAFLLAAEDLATRTPRRLLFDSCPHWAAAERELYPRAGDPGGAVLNGDVEWCGAATCDPTTRTAVHPDTGAPVPGRARCPLCHPQSPAALP